MPKGEPSPVIFDKSVLSNFERERAFNILQRLYEGRAFICRAFQREIQAGVESGWRHSCSHSRTRLPAIERALTDGWLQVPNSDANPNEEVVELHLALEYSQRTDVLKAESMAIARTRKWVFASDDSVARKFAKECGIRVTGSLGILIKAAKSAALNLSVADDIHSRMIDAGYCSPLPYNKGISSFFHR